MLKFAFLGVFLINFLGASPESSLHICTVASQSNEKLEQLIKSCDENHLTLTVFGLGLSYPGNGKKLAYLKNFVETLPDDDIVLLIDAYDCLILSTEKRLVETFLIIDKPCAISAEAAFCPHTHINLASLYPKSPTRFKYLNSGSIMGYVWYLKALLQAIAPINEKVSDQGQLHPYYLEHQNEIFLDVNCKLFLTLQNVKREDVEILKDKQMVYSKITNTIPCVIHGNGEGKNLYQHIFNHLFLDQKN